MTELRFRSISDLKAMILKLGSIVESSPLGNFKNI